MPEQIQSNPFNRPPRIQYPFKPVEVEVPAPPVEQDQQVQNLLLTILPMSSILLMGFFYIFAYTGSAQGGISGVFYALPMIAIGIFTVIISLVIAGEQKHQQKLRWVRQLREYHRQLDKKESRLVAGRLLQFDLLHYKFPPPQVLDRRIHNAEITLWERRSADADFLVLRLGLGAVPSQVVIRPPDPDISSLHIRRAFSLYTHYRTIPDSPVVINFRQLRSIGIVGPRSQITPFVYALLAQVVAFHSPEDVSIFLLSQEYRYKTWQWMRWLPHTSGRQSGGYPDYLAFGDEACRALITAISTQLDRRRAPDDSGNASRSVIGGPFMMVIFDGQNSIQDEPGFSSLIREGKKLGAMGIFLCETLEEVPGDCDAFIEVKGHNFNFAMTGPEGLQLHGAYDTRQLIQMDNFARRLMPITLLNLGQTSRIPTKVNLLQVYRSATIKELTIRQNWQRQPREDGLLPFEVSVGSESLVKPLELDLAENRDGPHGLIAGTTGSGKSELLQTLVSALAIENHPYFVNFLLVDFKGESTFGVFRELPHTVGMVSNLDTAGALRALEAIKAENLRRQRFLAEAKVEDILEYHKTLIKNTLDPHTWKPLPHLFIIVDEFAQLAVDLPNFLPELVATVRVGRSLGLHLILATQRPAGVVNDEMRANLNFRISLRVQTIDDSRDMLRRPDAALLPPDLPGRAYFQVGDGGIPRQFQAARVGIEYDDLEDPAESQKQSEPILYLLEYEARQNLIAQKKEEKDKDRPILSKKLTEAMQREYDDMRRTEGYQILDPILLPPLPLAIYFPEYILSIQKQYPGGWEAEKQHWKTIKSEKDADGIQAPVGWVDDLSRRAQPPLWINLQRKGGHVAIIGAPATGKTVLLRTLALSLAQRYSPQQVWIYALSFAGRGLDILTGLPHVGAVTRSSETERIKRLVRFLQEELDRRKSLLGDAGVLDLIEYNQKRSGDEILPVICVLIDNFAELRDSSREEELDAIEKLIQDGRAYGITFVITAQQSSGIPFKIMNLIDQRLALYMTDRNEYPLIIGRISSLEVQNKPGRGLTSDVVPLLFQITLPEENPEKEGFDAAGKYFEDTALLLKNAWSGSAPMPIQILPERVNLSQLLSLARKEWASKEEAGSNEIVTPIGQDGATLKMHWLNWRQDGPHFIISGPPRSGRTSILQAMLLAAAAHYAPDELMIVLVDGSQGSLRALKDLPHILEWVTDEDGLNRSIANLKSELAYRRDVYKDDEAEYQRMCFPAIIFAIDDYDLTSDALNLSDEILAQLGRHVRQDSHLGFHLWLVSVNQSVSDTSDPLLRQMKLSRSGIALSTADAVESLGGRATPAMHRDTLPDGRGYLLSRSHLRLMQFAYPDQASFENILAEWKDNLRAEWPNPASEEEIEQVAKDSGPSTEDKSAQHNLGDFFDATQDELVKEYVRLRNLEKGKS